VGRGSPLPRAGPNGACSKGVGIGMVSDITRSGGFSMIRTRE
jgi:hypothetical protein